MSLPLFPSLTPKIINPVWFSVDRPCDDENELAHLEQEHQTYMSNIQQKDCDVVPIGKTATEQEEEDDDEEEDDNDDDTSDSHDEEEDDDLEMEVTYDGETPGDARLATLGGSSLNPVR